MFSLGVKSERIYRKPYIPMLKEDNVRVGFFERGEFIALRNALPNDLQPVVVSEEDLREAVRRTWSTPKAKSKQRTSCR